MKKLMMMMVSVFALAGVVHAAPSADEAAIAALGQTLEKAHNAGDAKAITALYAADGKVMASGEPTATGREALLKFWTKDIADTKAAGVTLKVDPTTDIEVAGDWSWNSGTYAVLRGTTKVATGKWLVVNRKINGKWEIYRDAVNRDNAPKNAAPLAPASNK